MTWRDKKKERNNGDFLKSSYVCEAQIMRAFHCQTIFSDNWQFLFKKKQNSHTTLCLFCVFYTYIFVCVCVLYMINKISLVLLTILCTLKLGYLLSRFCIIYLSESATLKSHYFSVAKQFVIIMSSWCFIYLLCFYPLLSLFFWMHTLSPLWSGESLKLSPASF